MTIFFTAASCLACMAFAALFASVAGGAERRAAFSWSEQVAVAAFAATFLFVPIGALGALAGGETSAGFYFLCFAAAALRRETFREAAAQIAPVALAVIAAGAVVYMRGLPGRPASMEALSRTFFYGLDALGPVGVPLMLAAAAALFVRLAGLRARASANAPLAASLEVLSLSALFVTLFVPWRVCDFYLFARPFAIFFIDFAVFWLKAAAVSYLARKAASFLPYCHRAV